MQHHPHYTDQGHTRTTHHSADSPLSAAVCVLQDLFTAKPFVSVGGQTFRGTYDEEIGSCLFFDRDSLKRISDAQRREARDLEIQQTADEQPLVRITTKRLRLEPAVRLDNI